MMEQPSMQKAQENLLYIRQALEAAGQLTAVPGRSLIAAGFLALAGTAFNVFVTGAPWSPRTNVHLPIVTWGVVLALSLTVVFHGIYRKSLQMCAPIQPPLMRKILWSLCPALFVGALLTGLALQSGNLEWLPVIWLASYGAAVTNGGQVSVAPIRYMGLCFLLVAGVAAVSSPAMGLAWIAVGFGWLHIIFGAYIAWRHNE